MTAVPVAAAAAEAEYQETEDGITELIDSGEASPVHARDLLLKLHACKAEQSEVRALREAVVDRYVYKLQQLASYEAELRTTLEDYIVRINDGEKVSIPDAGTAYLTTKNKGGKLTVADEDALLAFLKSRFPKIVEAASKTTVHLGDALQMASDELAIRATSDGQVVTREGELVELPGVGAEPESKSLAVKAAA